MVLHRWGVSQDNFVLSAGLIMSIGHRKEFRKLTVRGLALRQGEGFFLSKDFLIGIIYSVMHCFSVTEIRD